VHAQITSNNQHPNQEVMVMQCDKVWDLLSAYADGEADPHEATLVEMHIAACSDCARDLQFMQGTHQVLQDVPEVEPPVSLRSAILAATVDRPGLGERLSTAVRRTLGPAPVRYGALAAAGAAAALTAVMLRDSGNPVHYTPDRLPVVAGAPAAPGTTDAARTGADLNLIDVYEQPAPGPAPERQRRTTSMARASRPAAAFRTAAATPSRPARGHSPRTSPVVVAGKQPGATDDLGASAPAPSSPGRTLPAELEPSGSLASAAPATSLETSSGAPVPRAISGSTRILLTSSAAVLDANQVASLADLRRSLSHKSADDHANTGLPIRPRDKQIRVDVIRGAF